MFSFAIYIFRCTTTVQGFKIVYGRIVSHVAASGIVLKRRENQDVFSNNLTVYSKPDVA